MSQSELTVRVVRGQLTECIHHGHLAVVNVNGVILHSAGEPTFVTYARSTAKPLQAIPVIESGAADHYNFSDEELALFCASHNGEQGHTETAFRTLNKIGLDAGHLQCGIHEPFHAPTTAYMREHHIKPNALHNNCSGKHSAMLALATHLHAPYEGYLSIEHPVQQLMLQIVSDMSGVPANELVIGIDGCGVPVFGMGLHQLARAYAALGNPEQLSDIRANACRRIVQAITQHPYYIAGSNRFDTVLIQTTKGRIIGKMGAEGVYAITIPELGLGIALKIEDGAKRALHPSVTEALVQLDLLTAQEQAELKTYHRPSLKNWQGTIVGTIDATVRLK
jgi:L-asparaginase II